jgi:hypothetical protein
MNSSDVNNLANVPNNIREFQKITDPDKTNYIIKKFLIQKPLFIKGYSKKIRAQILSFKTDGLFEIYLPESVSLQKDISLYATLGKFIEINFVLEKNDHEKNGQFRCHGAKIAKYNRKYERIPLENGEAFINNIKIASAKVETTNLNLANIFQEMQRKLEKELKNAPFKLKIIEYNPSNIKHRWIKETKKIFFIQDSQKINSNEELAADFIGINSYLKYEIPKLMEHYRLKKIKSELLLPIFDKPETAKASLLGLVQILSPRISLATEQVKLAQTISKEILDKIRADNMQVIRKRQLVKDIGSGGAKILIQDHSLSETLTRDKDFFFDLFFKMQEPITLHGKICNLYHNRKNELVVCVNFEELSAKDNLAKIDSVIPFLGKGRLSKKV